MNIQLTQEENQFYKGTVGRAVRGSNYGVASPGIVAAMTRMRQSIQLASQVTESRRSSRMSMGLDPDYAPQKVLMKAEGYNQPTRLERVALDQEQEIRQMDEHRITIEQICHRLGTDPLTGLTQKEAKRRLKQDGPCSVPASKKTPKWLIFIKEMFNFFSVLLWIAFALCLVAFSLRPKVNTHFIYLGALVVLSIVVSAVFSFVLAVRSQQSRQQLRIDRIQWQTAYVIREGKLQYLNYRELVVGDLVRLTIGNSIPADLRIVSADDLLVKNQLIGSPEPVHVHPDPVPGEDALTARNLMLLGSQVYSGVGTGIVVRTGRQTIPVRIASIAQEKGQQKTLLRKEMDHLAFVLSILTLIICVGLFLLSSLVLKLELILCLAYAVSILVASVPESLFTAVASAVALTAKLLFHRKIELIKFDSVQTLSSLSCLCLDKSVFVSEKETRLTIVWLDGHYHQPGPQLHSSPSYSALAEAAVHANLLYMDQSFSPDAAEIIQKPENANWLTVAMLLHFLKPHPPRLLTPATSQLNKPAFLSFASGFKFSLSFFVLQQQEHSHVAFVAGAPQAVLPQCDSVLMRGEVHPMDKVQEQVRAAVDRYRRSGQKVVAIARKYFSYPKSQQQKYYIEFSCDNPQTFNFDWSGLTLLGLLSLAQPVSPGSQAAVRRAKAAGIKLVLMTGEHIEAATGLAKPVGLLSLPTNLDLQAQGRGELESEEECQSIVVDSSRMIKVYEDGEEEGESRLLSWLRKKQCLFASVSPAQKLQVVRGCQKLGHVVGCTGTSLQDSPVLMQCDMPFARQGSPKLVRQLSNALLQEDSLSVVLGGVEQARTLFQNFKKMLLFILASNMAETLAVLSFVVLKMPLPIGLVLILVLSFGTDLLPAVSLAYEECEFDLMTRRPRKHHQHLITKRLLMHAYGQVGLMATAAGMLSFFTTMFLLGFPPGAMFGVITIKGYSPATTDIYTNNSAIAFGNTNLPPGNCSAWAKSNPPSFLPDWIGLSSLGGQHDLRQTLIFCSEAGRWEQHPQAVAMSRTQCRQKIIWPQTSHEVCFTSQAVFFGQSAYFAAIVLFQCNNIFLSKTSRTPLFYSPFNKLLLFAVVISLLVLVCVLYMPRINVLFGGRALSFFLVGTPSLLFSVLAGVWSEIRKLLIFQKGKSGNNWFAKQIAW